MERLRDAGIREQELEEALIGAYPALLALLRHRLPRGLRHDAEDLAQEALLAAWSALLRDSVGEIREPIKYLLGIARNKCLDRLRSPRLDEDLKSYRDGDLRLRGRVSEVAAERRLIEEENRKTLGEALARLSPLELRFLGFRYFEAMRNEEASRKLDLTPAEGSRLKYRALEKLRAHLEGKRAWRNRSTGRHIR